MMFCNTINQRGGGACQDVQGYLSGPKLGLNSEADLAKDSQREANNLFYSVLRPKFKNGWDPYATILALATHS